MMERFALIFCLLLGLGQQVLFAQKNTLLDLDYKNKTIKAAEEELGYEEYILKDGFFLDGLFQGASIYTKYVGITGREFHGGGIGFRLGNKWYFGKNRTYRPGIAAVWGRMNLVAVGGFNTPIQPYFSIAPANIGLINAFSFGGELGLEINVNAGFNAIVDLTGSELFVGYLINPTVKFRYKLFAVGIDVAIMKSVYLYTSKILQTTYIGLTVGKKI